MTTAGRDPDATYGTWWALVLSDWKRAGATVRIFTRGGATLGPGKVLEVRSQGDSSTLQGHVEGHLAKWDVDLTEVAAIEAVAP